MRAFYCDTFELPLPEGHRFPMAKYRRLRARLLDAGILEATELTLPLAATDEQILRVHDPAYHHRVVTGTLDRAEERRIGFPWSAGMVERSRRSVGGTIAASLASRDDGVAVNLAGGTHHAFADAGEGFCVFNDVAVAARALQATLPGTRCLVIDLDVHQGNGTAAIFSSDPTVTTFSMHGAKNFPLRKIPSDLDVELPDGLDDEGYLERLDAALTQLESFGSWDQGFYIAGADPFQGDRLGRLNLTKAGLAARDERVFAFSARHGLPLAVVMGGGYAHDIDDIVSIHAETIRQAKLFANDFARVDRG